MEELEEKNECIYCAEQCDEDRVYCSAKCFNADLNE
jgi:predicted nucleic acid-binding Zn ribbon protein